MNLRSLQTTTMSQVWNVHEKAIAEFADRRKKCQEEIEQVQWVEEQ